MQIRSWDALTDFANKFWDDQALSRLIRAEQNVALGSADDNHREVRCFSAGYFPGLLQTRGYVDAMCRGHMPTEWVTLNTTLRMARQRLMEISGAVQKFLVLKAVLVYRPNGFPEVIPGQLDYVINEIRKDMAAGRRTLDFRIIPDECLERLSPDVYRDTFTLYSVGNHTEGYIEPWRQSDASWQTSLVHGELQATNSSGVAYLDYSWGQLGNVALNPADSIDCMADVRRSIRA